MSDFTEVIDSVDERTLRRDLNDLLDVGILGSEGEKRGSVCFLK
jgi:predicted DNA-binding transcriptional regulator YafY